MKRTLTAMFLLVIFFVACQNREAPPLNPNGDSELAVLMRAMYDEAEANRRRIHEGKAPVVRIDHSRILSAEPTDPEQVNNETYRTFADSYIEIVQELKQTGQDHRKLYLTMVQSCRNCHRQLCPGPIVKIDKLDRNWQ